MAATAVGAAAAAVGLLCVSHQKALSVLFVRWTIDCN